MPVPPALLAAALPAALSVAAGAVVAAALGAVVAIVLLDRRRSGAAGARPTADEVRSILTRVERTLAEQRHQAETERRILAQKLEGVRRAIAHGAGVARGGVREAAGDREAKAEGARRQTEAAQGGAAQGGAADGSAPPVSDGVAGPRKDAFSPRSLDISELAPSTSGAGGPDETEAPADRAPEAGASDASSAVSSGDGSAGEAADVEPPSLFEPMTFAAPPAPAHDDAVWIARSEPVGAPATQAVGPEELAAVDDEPVPDDVVVPSEPPEGAEDLTVIGSIDAETEAHLYGLGILTLDDVARLDKSEAQRIERELGVAEATITGEWVFEAQGVLFERFSAAAVV